MCFQNQEGFAVDMSGWHVSDDANHRYTFPSFTLGAGSHVQLHTGSGVNTSTDLYWGSGAAIWNNGEDTVYLYDSAWVLVDEYGY